MAVKTVFVFKSHRAYGPFTLVRLFRRSGKFGPSKAKRRGKEQNTTGTLITCTYEFWINTRATHYQDSDSEPLSHEKIVNYWAIIHMYATDIFAIQRQFLLCFWILAHFQKVSWPEFAIRYKIKLIPKSRMGAISILPRNFSSATLNCIVAMTSVMDVQPGIVYRIL